VHVIFYLFNNTFSNLKIFQCQRIEWPVNNRS
jgi:hypothetical protein